MKMRLRPSYPLKDCVLIDTEGLGGRRNGLGLVREDTGHHDGPDIARSVAMTKAAILLRNATSFISSPP
jgi:hypothetical protein